MRARGWSALLVVAAVLAGCTQGPAEVAAPETSPATEVPASALVEPGPNVAVDVAPTVPPAPTAPVEVAAPVAGVPAPATPAAPAEDDPVPEGSLRPAPAPGRATAAPGGVQAAGASTAARPASTGRIEIPAIGLNHLTYEGVDLGTLAYGPGHWPGTALPGERGNTVFPGHRTTKTRPFWDIDKLRPGNEVIFTTASGRFTYRVTQTLIVGARDTWVVNPTPDPTFTIMACHPKGSARQRIVVKGTLVPPPPPPPTTRPSPPTTKLLGLL